MVNRISIGCLFRSARLWPYAGPAHKSQVSTTSEVCGRRVRAPVRRGRGTVVRVPAVAGSRASACAERFRRHFECRIKNGVQSILRVVHKGQDNTPQKTYPNGTWTVHAHASLLLSISRYARRAHEHSAATVTVEKSPIFGVHEQLVRAACAPTW